MKWRADPKLLLLKSLTDQHFFSFCYFIFVIAFLWNTKRSSPHSMSPLNLIKKYSPRKPICGSNMYFMPRPLWNMTIMWQINQGSELVSKKTKSLLIPMFLKQFPVHVEWPRYWHRTVRFMAISLTLLVNTVLTIKHYTLYFSTHSPVSEFVS